MNHSSPAQAKDPSPVSQSERIQSIDVLRGVAVLGILALNIQAFAMPGSAYMNPVSYGDLTGINYWIWYVVHLFGDLKFWGIFSMLFGAGILIMSERCEATGRSAVGIHYRRMLWLLVFGLLHAHLIWFGDILYSYAICGMILYWFRRLPVWSLIVLGVLSLSVAYGISMGLGYLLLSEISPEMQTEMNADWQPTAEKTKEELEIYRGSWLTQLPHRSLAAFRFETFLFLINFGWRTAGLVLIGMALHKLDVFSARRSRRFYATFVAIALLVGIPVAAYGVYRNEAVNWALEYSFFFGPLYNYWASVLIALGWVGAVMLVCQTDKSGKWTAPLAAAGRMALTCYLLESFLATLFFYGHGLGFFGYLERWQQYLFVVFLWLLLLVLCPVWLKYFQFGPIEWIWRTLTYWRIQPFRIR